MCSGCSWAPIRGWRSRSPRVRRRGICWVATSLATNYLFEGRRAALMLINGGYHAVRFTLFGLAFGLLG